jgi:hypothetical protein
LLVMPCSSSSGAMCVMVPAERTHTQTVSDHPERGPPLL